MREGGDPDLNPGPSDGVWNEPLGVLDTLARCRRYALAIGFILQVGFILAAM